VSGQGIRCKPGARTQGDRRLGAGGQWKALVASDQSTETSQKQRQKRLPGRVSVKDYFRITEETGQAENSHYLFGQRRKKKCVGAWVKSGGKTNSCKHERSALRPWGGGRTGRQLSLKQIAKQENRSVMTWEGEGCYWGAEWKGGARRPVCVLGFCKSKIRRWGRQGFPQSMRLRSSGGWCFL